MYKQLTDSQKLLYNELINLKRISYIKLIDKDQELIDFDAHNINEMNQHGFQNITVEGRCIFGSIPQRISANFHLSEVESWQ